MYFFKKFLGFSLAAALAFSSALPALAITDPEAAGSVSTTHTPAASDTVVVQPVVQSYGDPEAPASVPPTIEMHNEAAPSAPVQIKPTVSATVGNIKVSSTSDLIELDGEQISPESYNINGYNYFKLRDVAYLMIDKHVEFNVGWDNAAQSILITTRTPYQANGTEMQATGKIQTTKPSACAVLVDGTSVALTAYNISGNNYFKLRDIADAIGFDVGYDNTERVITIDSGTVVESYTVNFDLNGQSGSISPLTDVPVGATITSPITQAVNGYSFGGWYKDTDCTQAWDFVNDVVEADTTLYAQWLRSYTVSFVMNGHGAPVAEENGLVEGDVVTRPPTPTADGYTFDGWYADSGCSVPWNFASDKIGQNSIVLYAKWIANGSDVTPIYPDDTIDNSNSSSPDTITPPEPTLDNSSAIDGSLTILVDAGHGGSDGGTSGVGSLVEKEISLSVALKLQAMLEGTGANVIMTRTTDIKLQPDERKAMVSNNAEILDMVVVIHHNAANGVARGAEMLVPSDTQDPSGRSKYLGKLFLSEYAVIGQTSRGLKERPNLYMANVPASYGIPVAYSEFCFLDNATDYALVNTDQGQYNEAQAMYNAIMQYFETHSY